MCHAHSHSPSHNIKNIFDWEARANRKKSQRDTPNAVSIQGETDWEKAFGKRHPRWTNWTNSKDRAWCGMIRDLRNHFDPYGLEHLWSCGVICIGGERRRGERRRAKKKIVVRSVEIHMKENDYNRESLKFIKNQILARKCWNPWKDRRAFTQGVSDHKWCTFDMDLFIFSILFDF